MDITLMMVIKTSLTWSTLIMFLILIIVMFKINCCVWTVKSPRQPDCWLYRGLRGSISKFLLDHSAILLLEISLSLWVVMAAALKTTVKPYKLKPSGDSLSWDDLSTWREVILSHLRQNENWKDFLPGGTKSTWKAEEDNWIVEVKTALADFITCVASYSPGGFGETIKRESTSFNWVIELIKETYNLKTRGEHFLGLENLKFTFDGGFTYRQAYMEVKDFVCAGLLSVDDRFEGKDITQKEKLSPVAKNFICKEWLCKIDPRLPKHILDTRGHCWQTNVVL